MVMRDSFAESSRMNHLMRQKSAAFRKKRRFRVQQDPELRAAFGRRRLLELFVSAEDSVSREEIHGQLSVLATVGSPRWMNTPTASPNSSGITSPASSSGENVLTVSRSESMLRI